MRCRLGDIYRERVHGVEILQGVGRGALEWLGGVSKQVIMFITEVLMLV